jgi:hypothetical protein
MIYKKKADQALDSPLMIFIFFEMLFTEIKKYMKKGFVITRPFPFTDPDFEIIFAPSL